MAAEEEARLVASAFRKYPVALIGCRALGINRPGCEYDLLIVTRYKEDFYSIKSAGRNVDVVLVPKEALLQRPGSKLAFALHSARVLWDEEWAFPAAMKWAREHFHQLAEEEALLFLIHGRVKIGRAIEAQESGDCASAALWIASSAYDACHAYLLLNGIIPSPSHMAEQLRGIPARKISGFLSALEALLDLDLASATTCRARLDALGILRRLLESLGMSENLSENLSLSRTPLSLASIESTEDKVRDLLERRMASDAFFYLGAVLAGSIEQTYSTYCSLLHATADHARLLSNLEKSVAGLLEQSLLSKLVLNVDRTLVEEKIAKARALVDSLRKLTS